MRKRVNVHPLKLALVAPLILLVVAYVGRALTPLVYAHVNVHNFEPDGGEYLPDIWLQNWGRTWRRCSVAAS